ncbi:hypothetical protein LJB42_004053 [Komagataella kurtzmanii]|nr:hypothetical protein LJB42_004053 [Komagataella kurtzmanii]
MTEAKPQAPKEGQDSQEIFFSTGRGGAGNMGKGESLPSPKLEPQRSRISTNENELSPIYSTGRGGFGNMQNKKDIGEMAHLDEEMGIAPVHSKKMSEQQQHVAVGRGGYGNVLTASQSRGLEDREETSEDAKPRNGNSFFRKIKKLFS